MTLLQEIGKLCHMYYSTVQLYNVYVLLPLDAGDDSLKH